VLFLTLIAHRWKKIRNTCIQHFKMYKAEGCKNHKLSYMNQTIIGRKREQSVRCFSVHRNFKSKVNESHRMAATLGMLADSHTG